MKKLDENLPHPRAMNEGWVVHIYDRNRRLLCTLDPSHGWSMLAGLTLGVVLTIGLVGLTHSNTQAKSAISPMQAPLSVD